MQVAILIVQLMLFCEGISLLIYQQAPKIVNNIQQQKHKYQKRKYPVKCLCYLLYLLYYRVYRRFTSTTAPSFHSVNKLKSCSS